LKRGNLLYRQSKKFLGACKSVVERVEREIEGVQNKAEETQNRIQEREGVGGRMEYKVYLRDWYFNAGIIGFLTITADGRKLDSISSFTR
jgi:hypothetical protein